MSFIMTTKISVKFGTLEFGVETESESDARKLIADLSDKFTTGATRKDKKLSK